MRDPSMERDSTRTERLVRLGKLWATVKYFHPFLAYRNVDWDDAVLEAIPTVMAASTKPQYETALRSLLETLDDPATRVVESPDQSPEQEGREARPAATR